MDESTESNESSFCCIRLPRRRHKKREEGRFHCVIIFRKNKHSSIPLFPSTEFPNFSLILPKFVLFPLIGIVYGQSFSFFFVIPDSKPSIDKNTNNLCHFGKVFQWQKSSSPCCPPPPPPTAARLTQHPLPKIGGLFRFVNLERNSDYFPSTLSFQWITLTTTIELILIKSITSVANKFDKRMFRG